MIKRLIVIVTILSTVFTTAQENTSSPYSFYGIGLTKFKGTVENRSMGGISTYSDSIHMNLTNPAGFGKLRLTTYTVAGTHSSLSFKSNSEKESASVTTLDYLAVGIPTGKFGFGFGLIPYTSMGYNLFSADEGAGTAGRFTGEGGLNKVFLSAGFNLTDNISIGAGVDYGFGNLENKNILIREGIQFGSQEVNSSRLSGFSYNFGMEYQRMLNEKLELRLSGLYVPESKLSSENARSLATVALLGGGEQIIDRRDLDVVETEYTMPSKYTVGTGIGQPRKWFVGLEYTGIGEADFNNRSFSPEGAVYTDASIYKIGGFFIPNYNSLTSYFSRIVFRGGFRMEETGLQLEGEDINEFGITFGLGLPAGNMFSNVNLGFEYGQRGTTNAGLLQEDFFNVSISLSLNDRWFIQRKFD